MVFLANFGFKQQEMVFLANFGFKQQMGFLANFGFKQQMFFLANFGFKQQMVFLANFGFKHDTTHEQAVSCEFRFQANRRRGTPRENCRVRSTSQGRRNGSRHMVDRSGRVLFFS